MKLTSHAVKRYRERLSKEHLTDDQAAVELGALLAAGPRFDRLPWYGGHEPHTDFYVEISDGIACPVVNGYVVTVVVRGSLGEHGRANRNKRHAWRRRMTRWDDDNAARRREDKAQRSKQRRWTDAA